MRSKLSIIYREILPADYSIFNGLCPVMVIAFHDCKTCPFYSGDLLECLYNASSLDYKSLKKLLIRLEPSIFLEEEN